MTAEVEALLARLDRLYKSNDRLEAVSLAAALIRAQAEEIAGLSSAFKQVCDGIRGAMQDRDTHIECLQDAISKLREQIAARQEPVACPNCGVIADSPKWRYAEPIAAGDAVSVPMVPTEAMLIAARDWSAAKYGKPIGNDAACECYLVMIAAGERK
jgi:hypothetical protein